VFSKTTDVSSLKKKKNHNSHDSKHKEIVYLQSSLKEIVLNNQSFINLFL
jgi:hypothetical protein